MVTLTISLIFVLLPPERKLWYLMFSQQTQSLYGRDEPNRMEWNKVEIDVVKMAKTVKYNIYGKNNKK